MIIRIVSDIRFWIVILFVARLYSITSPPLEIHHTWRQTDGTTIARNFYERDNNIFFPRIDLAGEKEGIVGSEFPVLNYLIYLMSLLFGYSHWYGRLLVLVASSFGVFYFYRSIRAYFSESAAFNSAILLMGSFWFSYSRKIVPDVFAASLVLIALYFALRYLREGQFYQLALLMLFGALGCLSKILAATLLTVLALPLFDTKIQLNRKMHLAISASFILATVIGWYFMWVPYLNQTFGFEGYFFMGMSYEEGLHLIVNDWQPMLKRIFISPLKYSGLMAFVVALALVAYRQKWTTLAVFALPFFSYMLIIARTGSYMVWDHYYILTMIPAFVFLIGCGLDYLPTKNLAILLCVVAAAESIGDQFSDFRIRAPFAAMADLEKILDIVSKREELIIVNGESGNPTFMYFAHRRGWAAPNKEIEKSDFLPEKIRLGCRFVVAAKKIYGDLDLNYPVVYDDENFKIYKLSPPSSD